MPVSDKDGDVNKTKEIMTHAKDEIQKRRFKRTFSKAWCTDLQEGQEVQLYQSLPLVQFDPERDK